jgi:hypothetical protein
MIRSLIIAAVLLGATAPLSAQRRAGAPRALPDPARAPTLVVFFTVDQLRPDYFDRWRTQLTGGLGRLSRGGAFYTNAFHDHALTETAPGHSVTMSGRFPRRTGIVRNSQGVYDPQQPLVAARGPGASPFRFRGTTLTDWLRVKNPRTRALSVSGKDRGAILPIGRDAQQVFWFAAPGVFTTSRYYADTLPDWVRRFNERRLADSLAVRPWTLLLPDSAYAERDDVPQEANGRDFIFPHVAATDTAWGLPATPFYDELTLAFALQGLRALDLGAGPHTDILAVSLSATDYVGHKYGPDSREVHDQVLRLDRAVGAFLDSLFTIRDSTKVIIALTADHGVASFPEVYAQRTGAPAFHVDVAPALSTVRRRQQRAAIRWRDDSARSAGNDAREDQRRFAAARAGADAGLAARRAAGESSERSRDARYHERRFRAPMAAHHPARPSSGAGRHAPPQQRVVDDAPIRGTWLASRLRRPRARDSVRPSLHGRAAHAVRARGRHRADARVGDVDGAAGDARRTRAVGRAQVTAAPGEEAS